MNQNIIKSYLKRCRMCLTKVSKQFPITKDIEERFLIITQTELEDSEEYSKFICEECDDELRNIQNFRKELILKQRKLKKYVERAKDEQTNVLKITESSYENVEMLEEDFIEIIDNYDEQIEEIVDDDSEEERCEKFNVKKYFCDICGDKTLLKSNLESHMKAHKTARKSQHSKTHKRKPQTYSCIPCGKEFKSRSQLVDHTRRIHENVRDYQCQYCSNFYAKRELSVHVKRVHMKEVVFCEICGNSYASAHSLRTHKKYHESPKFNCTFEGCGKSFVTKQVLINHEKIHLNQRDHLCQYCCKKFFSVSHLKRHLKRHMQLI